MDRDDKVVSSGVGDGQAANGLLCDAQESADYFGQLTAVNESALRIAENAGNLPSFLKKYENTHAWIRPFLSALAVYPNVTEAARTAGVERCTAYAQRRVDPAFKAAWDAAFEQGADVLEHVAYERVLNGTPKPIVSSGKLLGWYNEYPEKTHLELLRASNPKYRAASRQDGGSGGNHYTVNFVFNAPGSVGALPDAGQDVIDGSVVEPSSDTSRDGTE